MPEYNVNPTNPSGNKPSNYYSKNKAKTAAEMRARDRAIKMSQQDDKPRRPVVTEDTTANTTAGSSTSTTTSSYSTHIPIIYSMQEDRRSSLRLARCLRVSLSATLRPS